MAYSQPKNSSSSSSIFFSFDALSNPSTPSLPSLASSVRIDVFLLALIGPPFALFTFKIKLFFDERTVVVGAALLSVCPLNNTSCLLLFLYSRYALSLASSFFCFFDFSCPKGSSSRSGPAFKTITYPLSLCLFILPLVMFSKFIFFFFSFLMFLLIFVFFADFSIFSLVYFVIRFSIILL